MEGNLLEKKIMFFTSSVLCLKGERDPPGLWEKLEYLKNIMIEYLGSITENGKLIYMLDSTSNSTFMWAFRECHHIWFGPTYHQANERRTEGSIFLNQWKGRFTIIFISRVALNGMSLFPSGLQVYTIFFVSGSWEGQNWLKVSYIYFKLDYSWQIKSIL